MRILTLRSLILVMLLSPCAMIARGEEPSRFVRTQTGELPIILSAPHGGKLDVPNVAVRKGEGLGTGGSGFVVSRDTGTEELAQQAAAAIEKRFGKKPYFVIARSHRKYLDPNRPPEIAYEDADAKPVYDAYHSALRDACREVQQKFHKGLLLDIHGQGTAKDTVFRGTQNGKTVTLLRERFGEAAHVSETSLFGRLKTHGWKVHPDPLDVGEQAAFRGGYIVQTYGSHQGFGIDAIQLEFGSDYRTQDAREKAATTLTNAVAEYATSFLDITLAAQSKKSAAIQIAVYKGAGTGDSREKIIKVLAKRSNLKIRDVTVDDIRAGKFKGCHVLIQPGGGGGVQGRALGEEGRQQIREFVKSGGGYVGVCAGAYLATCDYDWSLNILDAKVVDRKHWNRGFGTVEISLSPHGQEFFGVDRERLSIYYHQGPLLAPADNPDIPDFDSLAKFETEIAKNGAPTGVMPGCTAIASGLYHQGRVLCISPHPELTDGQEQLLVRAVEWVAVR
ncbi:MAG: N-formylglutamate amidohydrolase [Planctomycetaceae bacterium]|nr:N-formylglutamate amidohydrolase [Planctomycetaceae bacterium]